MPYSIAVALPGKAAGACDGVRALAGPVMVTAAMYGLFIAARLALHGGDPSAFVAAGDMFANALNVPTGLHILSHSSGYDGQAYYRLALDPWTARPTDYGIWLDNPAYRQQRILYPLLAWVLSLGRPAFVPAALIAVNFAGLCLITVLGAAIARSFHRPSWWGILPALYPGFLVTLALDLTEIVEPALLLGGVLLVRRTRYGGAALCFTLAVLTRETALLVPATFGLLWAFHRLKRQPPAQPAVLFAAPMATYLAWQTFLWSRWHSLPFRGNSGNIGVPGAGFADFVRQLAAEPRPEATLWLLEIAALLIFALGVLSALRGRSAPSWLRLAWVMYGLLTVCLGASVWVEDIGFLRALSEWYVLGALLLTATRPRFPGVFVAPSLALWAWIWLAMALL